jgi:hypothetical protein
MVIQAIFRSTHNEANDQIAHRLHLRQRNVRVVTPAHPALGRAMKKQGVLF